MNENMQEQVTQENFATEMLRYEKSITKTVIRMWIITFIIMAALELGTIGGFLWYLSLPVDVQTVEMDGGEGNVNYIENTSMGDIYNGESESD